LRYGPSLPYLF